MNKKIVVLYKKSGKAPVIKLITNMFEIKKMIIQDNLDMIKFENCIIVCKGTQNTKNDIPNIVLDFKNIAGDFFLIGYDVKKKDFRSLTKSEINFYKDTLDRKSFQYEKYQKWLEKCKNIEENSSNDDFEKDPKTSRKIIREIGESEEKQSTSSLYNEKMLEMILNIQTVIFKFIKNMNGDNN